VNAESFIERIKKSPWYRGQIVRVHAIPARKARYAQPKHPLPAALRDMLSRLAIEQLYAHQARAVDCAAEGKNFIVVTSTASGKTFCYVLPVFESILKDERKTALLLYPTKALAQDQLRIIGQMAARCEGLSATAGTYDGDTPPALRRKLRDSAAIILTNPDMLHQGILPNHARWSRFFAHLGHVVLDEVHSYRGLFGSNVANVMTRLKRITAHYGADPQFICSSATIANPASHAQELTGREMVLIAEDGSPSGKKFFVLWNPPPLGNWQGRGSPLDEAVQVATELIKADVQVIAFLRTRSSAERLLKSLREKLSAVSPALARAVEGYRGGYLPEERREVERKLARRELLGVASTCALELGIDIGSMDACFIVGYPGTIASTWQQAGRAGRRSEESVVFLMAQNTPIDQYLMHNPRYLFEQSPENAVVDPHNVYVTLGHVKAAAQELPLKDEECPHFGQYAEPLLEILQEDLSVRKINDRWYWSGKGYPASAVNLRSISAITYTVMEEMENRVVGHVDELSAFSQIHDHAVYLHGGETYFVRHLDTQQKVAFVQRQDLDYFTQAVTDASIRVERDEEIRQKRWRISQTGLAPVTVTSVVSMFKKVRFASRQSIGFENLDLPPQELETVAWWILPPQEALMRVRGCGREPTEGLVGIANVLVEVVPLFVMCDAMDIGTAVDSSNMDSPTLFVFDKYPYGMGFSEKAFELTEDIMQATAEIVHGCGCQTGCPSCVGAATPAFALSRIESGTRGRIPDKEAALVLLHEMLELPPYVPKYPAPRQAGEQTQGEIARQERKTATKLPAHIDKKIRDRLK